MKPPFFSDFLKRCVHDRRGQPEPKSGPGIRGDAAYKQWLLAAADCDAETFQRWMDQENLPQTKSLVKLLSPLGLKGEESDLIQQQVRDSRSGTPSPTQSATTNRPSDAEAPVDAKRPIIEGLTVSPARRRATQALAKRDASPLVEKLNSRFPVRDGTQDGAWNEAAAARLVQRVAQGTFAACASMTAAVDDLRQQELEGSVRLSSTQLQECKSAATHLFVVAIYEYLLIELPVLDEGQAQRIYMSVEDGLKAALAYEAARCGVLEFAAEGPKVRLKDYLTENDLPAFVPGKQVGVMLASIQRLADPKLTVANRLFQARTNKRAGPEQMLTESPSADDLRSSVQLNVELDLAVPRTLAHRTQSSERFLILANELANFGIPSVAYGSTLEGQFVAPDGYADGMAKGAALADDAKGLAVLIENFYFAREALGSGRPA